MMPTSSMKLSPVARPNTAGLTHERRRGSAHLIARPCAGCLPACDSFALAEKALVEADEITVEQGLKTPLKRLQV